MPDLLQTIRDELDTRMHEMRPFVTEYEHLLASTNDKHAASVATPYDAPTPHATSSIKTSPVPTIPVAIGSAETIPLTDDRSNANRVMTRLAPGRLHRPRRTLLRPAFPKDPRRGAGDRS